MRIHSVDREILLSTLLKWAQSPDQRIALYVNVHAMNIAASDSVFRSQLNAADLTFCDGYGVLLAAKLLGRPLKARLTPPDWIDDFAKGCGQSGCSVFALGDEPGVAAVFQERLTQSHSSYLNAGSHHGFFKKSGAENEAVVDLINRSGAHVLLVGLGMPIQERWIFENAEKLRPRLVLAVGALFRWMAEIERRAPKWMTDNGLEWLARLVRHPRRHFSRYVLGNPRFLARVMLTRLRQRVP